MSRRRRSAVGAALLAVALIAAACSDDGGVTGAGDDTGSTASTAGAASTTTVVEIAPARGTIVYELPGDGVFPEGVAYDPVTDRFFVSSTEGGTVFVGDRGTGEVSVFSEAGADGRDNAVGVATDPERRRLWVAGGEGQSAFVYDLDTGDLVTDYAADPFEDSFLNDVVVAPDGDAYLTDSGPRPVLFRVPDTGDGPGELEEWLDLPTTPIPTDGAINLNGLVATDEGRYLMAVHTSEGRLYRLDRDSRDVTAVGAPDAVAFGDGLALDGARLWAVSVAGVQAFELSTGFDELEAGPSVNDETFAFPTTTALVDGRLLVVNSQFNAPDAPVLPFTVSELPAP